MADDGPLAEVIWLDAAEHRGDPLGATLREKTTWGRLILDSPKVVIVIHDTDDDGDSYCSIIPRSLIESITYLRPDTPVVSISGADSKEAT